MTLKVALTIDERELLYQQSTYCKVKLTNAGRQPISVGLPPMDPTEPAVHVIQTKAGTETVHRGAADDPEDAMSVLIAPGSGVESGFNLLDVVEDLPPGQYQIRISWGFTPGDERVMSQSVDLKVLPTTPFRLVTAAAAAGDSTLMHGVWLDLANEPNYLVRSTFYMSEGGGAADLVRVAKASTLSKASISAPGHPHNARSQWVGWIEGAALNFAHVDAKKGVSKPRSIALPTEDAEIVTPMFISPSTGGPARPAGAALLCLGIPGARQFRLQTIELTQDAGKPKGASDVKGYRPDWIHGHVRELKEWLVVWVQTLGLDVFLSRGDWPEIKAQEVGAKELAKWKGRFMAAGSATGRDLSVNGGVLLREALSDEEESIVMVPWTLSPDNEYEEGDHKAIPWDPRPPIARAQVYVNDEGLAVALLRDEEGVWHFFDGDQVVPVAAWLMQTDQQLELGFLNGVQDPLLISNRVNLGLLMMCLDGSPIPEAPV